MHTRSALLTGLGLTGLLFATWQGVLPPLEPAPQASPAARQAPSPHPARTPLALHHAEAGVSLQLTADGRAELTTDDHRVTLRTHAVGRGEAQPVGPQVGAQRGNRLVATDGRGIASWFHTTDAGVQQGWTIPEQTGDGELTIEVAVDGLDVRILEGGQTLALGDDGLVGTDLRAWDADGDDLPVRARRTHDGFAMVVDVDAADWPVYVDPTWADAGGSLEGAADDRFGHNLAPAGDVNGDGLADFVIASPGWGTNGEGRLQVFHGGGAGPEDVADWTFDGPSGTTGLGEAGTLSHGDVNGDGYDDLVVGSPSWENGNGQAKGRVWIFHGSESGLSPTADTTLTGLQTDAGFGHAIAVGDFDGDGMDDLAVGEPDFDVGTGIQTFVDAGRFRVFDGSDTGITSPASLTVVRRVGGLHTGASLAAGRFTADGYADLAVGVPGHGDDLTEQGMVAIHRGAGNGLRTQRVRTWTGSAADLRMGHHVSNLGDVNGDGMDDVGVGMPRLTDDQTEEGRVAIYLGGEQRPDEAAHLTVDGDQADARLGTIRAAGDVDGDGYDDVLIAAGLYDDGETDNGKVWLHMGGSTGLAGTAEETFSGDAAGDELGGRGARDTTSVHGIGDLDGDGRGDLLLGAPRAGSDEGAVTLRHGDATGTTATVPEQVDPPIISAWTLPTGTAGDALTFSATATDAGGGTLTWLWDFGDGTTSTDETPTHTYAHGGVFDVTLTITDEDDERTRSSGRVVVDNQAPVLESAQATTGWVGDAISFSASATDAPGDMLTWLWTFGDGSTSNEAEPTHTYASEGDWPVTVTVYDGHGGSDSTTFTVQALLDHPTVDSVTIPSTANEGEELTFSASASLQQTGQDLTYTWDFGDGETATGETVTHAFADDGSFTTTLTVSTPVGGEGTSSQAVTIANVDPTIESVDAPDPMQWQGVALTADATDPGDDTLTYTWDFGDGNTGTGQTVQHAWYTMGTFTTTLTVTDGDGGSAVSTQDVVVGPNTLPNTAPAVVLLDHEADEGEEIAFEASISDAENDSLTVLWDFGDGTTSDEVAPDKLYEDDGTYTVTLSVTDLRGLNTTVTATAIVENLAPTAEYTFEAQGDEGDSLAFSAEAFDIDADPVTYKWNFQDGTPIRTGASPNHTFADDGTYDVLLEVSDDDGGVQEYVLPVQIDNVAPTLVVPQLQLDATEGVLWTADFQAFDPGADTLTFHLIEQPRNMHIDHVTGTITWMPDWRDVRNGVPVFSVRVSDGDGGIDEHDAILTLTATDADQDGMTDTYESEFGLDPQDPTDVDGDPDGDGRSNAMEFEDGTDASTWSGPATPEPQTPTEGRRVGTAQPKLSWASLHPLGEEITFTLELYADADLTESLMEPVEVTTRDFVPEEALTENTDVFWRVRAADAFAATGWSVTSSFFVNAVNSAPDAPTPLFPVDDAVVAHQTAVLQWSLAEDEDRDALTYDVVVRRQEDQEVVWSDEGLVPADGEAHVASELWTQALFDKTVYEWQVTARDETGTPSAPTDWQTFRFRDVVAPHTPRWDLADDGATVSASPELRLVVRPDPDVRQKAELHLFDNADFEGDPAHALVVDLDASQHEIIWSLRDEGIELANGAWHARARLTDDLEQSSPWATARLQVDSGLAVGCNQAPAGVVGWLGLLGLMGLRRRRR